VNTPSAVASLKAQLIADSEALCDVDQVAADSTVLIPAATLTDSTTLQSDGTTLDLMDRVHAASITPALGSVALQAQAAATVEGSARQQFGRTEQAACRSVPRDIRRSSRGTPFKLAKARLALGSQLNQILLTKGPILPRSFLCK